MKKLSELTNFELLTSLSRGAKIIQFQYCFSFIFLTLTRQSPLFLKNPKEGVGALGLKYAIISLLFGPWSIPWGPLRALQSLIIDLRGGRDMTSSVVALMKLNLKKSPKEGGEIQIDS